MSKIFPKIDIKFYSNITNHSRLEWNFYLILKNKIKNHNQTYE